MKSSSSCCCFKMDKNSTFATKLKSAISLKLNHFLVNYTDDVLAEYIIVLICNGKDQNQARNDLEAFLGENSAEFVSWLWDLLLKSVDRTRKRICPSYPKDVYTRGCDGVVNDKHRVRMLKGLQSHAKGNDNILCNDEKEYCPVTFAPQPVSSDDIEVSEGSQRRSTGLNNSRNRIKDREVVSIYSDGVPPLRRYLAKKELQPRNSQSVERENPNNVPSAETNADEPVFPSKPVASDSHRNPKPRGNVWDRLGKPCDEQRNVRVETVEVEDVDLVKDGIVEHPGEAHDQKTSVLFGRLGRRSMGETPAPDNGHGTIISKTNGEYKRLDHDVNAVRSPHYKKREFSEIGSGPANGSISLRGRKSRHLQDREPLEEFQRSSAKRSCSENLNSIASGTRQTGGLETCQALGVPNSAFIPGANGVAQRKFCREALEADPSQALFSNHSLTKSELVRNEDAVETDLKPVQAQMLDVKLKLQQIEMEMSKIKGKQVESNDGKPDLLSSSGAVNHSDDDAESRTIFVTNVHFAATKEALSLHFSKCGLVVKVVILSDAVTAQPKGAAYITFAHKESTDKAVALSGTSFWSRTIQVVRKGEIPVVTSAPPQPSGYPTWSQLPQPIRKVVFQRPYSVSHFRWRRDQPVSTDQSISTSGHGSEASRTVEDNYDNSGGQLHNSLATVNTAEEDEGSEETSTDA
ncbi:hypothetical protein IFM89_030797 [Coptis chinensis]|uniref:RRM domain-containing protein n=1 Tax=Coptis chinensis TaxID=261450 RepID=A0A835M1X6_9MAGN|nr:hypothetical protein IFM89_030797 [Coptis chinensis]